MLAIALSLAAASSFALSSMLISSVSARMGLFQLARWQMGIAFVLTATASIAIGGWRGLTPTQFGLLSASSASGIMLASTTFFATIYVTGPRVTAMFFALAAPFALLLGYLFLGETINATQGLGIAMIVAGILFAVAMPEKTADAPPRRVPLLGVALGLITAIGQAGGSLFARPAMASGVDPFTAMAIRSGLGVAFYILLMAFPFARAAGLPGPRAMRDVSLSALFGMFLGMSLMMAALSYGEVGIVTTLSSMTPILILPMIWATSRRAPGLWAWLGAALAVAGTAVISLAA